MAFFLRPEDALKCTPYMSDLEEIEFEKVVNNKESCDNDREGPAVLTMSHLIK